MSYRIGYGLFGGGHAKYSIIQDSMETKAVVSGRSNSFVDLFFIVRNRYETIINNRTLFPRYFKRNNNEGGHLINQEYFFNQDLKIVNTQNGKFKCDVNTFDMLSSFLFGRSLKSDDLKKKEPLFINMFLDEEIYNNEVIFLGKETIIQKLAI